MGDSTKKKYRNEKMLSLDLEGGRKWISYHCKTSFLEDFFNQKDKLFIGNAAFCQILEMKWKIFI